MGSKKGPRGELEVVGHLQPWWRRLEPAATFVRTPRSGGWGSTKTSGFRARGDVMVDPDTCKLFPFSVEVKRREGFDDGYLMGGRKSPVWGWWAQVVKAAEGDRLRPLLWFRKNNQRRDLKGHHLPPLWYVMFESVVFDQVRLRGMAPPLVRFEAPRHTVILTHEQFLWFPPQALVQACRQATEIVEAKLAGSYGFVGHAR